MKTRTRQIKDSIWGDFRFAKLSMQARLYFIALWAVVDREGKVKYIPEELKARLFPYDNFLSEKFINELLDQKFIEIYESDNLSILRVINFGKHQNFHNNEKSYQLPDSQQLPVLEIQGDTREVDSKRTISIRRSNSISESRSKSREIQKTEQIPYSEIIADLNMRLGSKYKYTTDKTQEKIKARWDEGFRLKDFVQVHINKIADWCNDPKFSKYLRPETLYGNKFEGYLNEKKALAISDNTKQMLINVEESLK